MSDNTEMTPSEGVRKPRIAIMGEFSAGKSTLCNLLMNGDTLPRKVTATQLAPVWMTHGNGSHARVLLDGTEEPITIDELADVPIEGTLYTRLELPQEVLLHCDFIDFPGISDPNMDPDVWGRLLDKADSVLWLTHATQAWRQTEAAVWDIVPEEVQERSLLLMTRWDKLTNETDKARVYNRIRRETIGLFKEIIPISLTDALKAGDNVELWEQSGAARMMEQLVEIMGSLNSPAENGGEQRVTAEMVFGVDEMVMNGGKAAGQQNAAQAAPENVVKIKSVGPTSPQPVESNEPRIVPRRVRPETTPRRERPNAAQG